MRIWWGIFGGLLLTGCQKEKRPLPEEPPISYSREVRPILAKHCASCHTGEENRTGYALSLRDPKIPLTFTTPHPEGSMMTPEEDGLLLKWRAEEGEVDGHWAFGPLQPVEGWAPEPTVTKAEVNFPEGDFREKLRKMIAGDLLPDADSIVETRALREEGDRLKQVSEMIGFPIDGVSVTEGVSAEDFLRMKHIFSTPYDELRNNPLDAPTAILGEPAETPVLLWHEKPHDEEFAVWLAEKDSVPQMPDLVAAISFDDGTPSNIALGHFNPSSFSLTETVEGIAGIAVASPKGVVLPSQVAFPSHQYFTLSLWVKVASNGGMIPLLGQGDDQHGFYLGLEDGRPVARFTRYWPGNAIGITSESSMVFPGRWTNITLTYDGSRKAAGLQFYVNGLALDSVVEADSLKRSIFSGEEAVPAKLGGWASEGVALDEIQLYRRKLSALEIATLRDGTSLLKTFVSAQQDSPLLREYYLSAVNQDARARQVAMLKNRAAQLAAEDALEEIPVMESLPRAEPPVKERTTGPMFLDTVDRLAFVDTLISEDKYLLARSLVNSVWEAHFGEALVPDLGYSGMDLGRAGELDFLAAKLIDLNWDLSKLSASLSSPTSP
ncbi:LamG domain-containing protein [Akkermansiaceae bacterium]|nr:LamG domain-containing protein [Akkermansiaceae bacterium]MDB4288592.1 LamG domain-containing protein [bacterium]MDB4288946.1 LamG domain-containing protein [bacterium]MDB4296954.1 LamG domain-containing protein [Akkermansiaceae bacterium]MDB4317603.1 LamG domain-containing protein [bacterium]